MEQELLNKLETQLALIHQDLSYVKAELGEVKKMLKEEYVTVSEFDPVRKIVYGLVSIVLVGVIGAILALVLKQ